MLCHRPAKYVIVLTLLAGIGYPATAQVRVERTVPKRFSEQNRTKRLSHIDNLRNAIGEGESLDEPVAQELLKVVADPAEDAFVRGAALELLCEKGDSGTGDSRALRRVDLRQDYVWVQSSQGADCCSC